MTHKKNYNTPTPQAYYETLIIGGGIVGSGIFRDLALHGQQVCMVDKGDFNSQTSQGSSKMLHGGIRYLENFDFELIKEALHEKNLWLKLAPHLTDEKYFHMPNYHFSKYPLWALRLGFQFYDMLSFYQNAPSYSLNKQQTLQKFPQLLEMGLRGSGVYSDAVVDDAKLGLECIYDGLLEPNAEAFNYIEVTHIERTGAHYKVELNDTIQHQKHTIECHNLVLATGPFTDQFIQKSCPFIQWTPKLAPSKGIHLWIDKNVLPIDDPIVIQTNEGRVIFVIPYPQAVLVGTTEGEVKDDFFNIQANDQEIHYLLNNLQTFFPHHKFTHKDILSSYAAIRPLVKADENSELGKISRVHKTYRPLNNLFIIIGGKYTTFRVMAQDVARQICLQSQTRYNPNKTMSELRQPSLFTGFELPSELTQDHIERIIHQEKVRTFEDLFHRRLSIASKGHWERQGRAFDKDFSLIKSQYSL